MLNSVSHLTSTTVSATDGTIGHVRAAFFDDQSWAIRYLVVNTGNWLTGREVLISPYAVKPPVGSGKNIDVALTREQVKNSPDIDTHQPVSRQHEREYLRYYAYPEYWDGGGLWAMGAYPLMPITPPSQAEIDAAAAEREEDRRHADVHLRSSGEVIGYDIQASDDSIGHVQDFVFDDESWAIRYFVVDTRNWWPGGAKVLIAAHWISRIVWDTKKVYVALTREQVKNSPCYEEGVPITREYEKQLHAAYEREGYWPP